VNNSFILFSARDTLLGHNEQTVTCSKLWTYTATDREIFGSLLFCIVMKMVRVTPLRTLASSP